MIGRASGGAITLTLASTLLLSGLWCMLLSPIASYSRTRRSSYITIDAFRNWTDFTYVQEGEILTLVTVAHPQIENASATAKMYVYAPEPKPVPPYDRLCASFHVREVAASMNFVGEGLWKFEIENPNPQALGCYISITTKTTYRPVEPLGQWISLISLPIFGLGIWASGIFSTIRRQAD